MKKVLLSILMGAALAATATATPIVVTVGFNGTLNNGIKAPVSPGDTFVNFTSTSFSGTACTYVALCAGDPTTNLALFDSGGAANIFTWGGGTLVYTTTSVWAVTATGPMGSRTFTINTTGTYTSSIPGYVPTDGNLNFTFQEPPVSGPPEFYTFSASGTTVPEPGSLALLGSGLLGLGLVARRRRQQ